MALDPAEAGGISDLTRGGVDWAFEATGQAGVLEAAYEQLRRGGSVVTIGLPKEGVRFSVQALSLVDQARSVIGSYMGTSVPQRDIPRLVALWQAGRLPVDRLLDAKLPLSEANEALDDLRSGHVVRQVLIPHPP